MKFLPEKIWKLGKVVVTLHSLLGMRALSSAGSERLPYKQRVGGSNPSAPTNRSEKGPLAQLNRALDYGSRGYRFESYTDHFRTRVMGIFQSGQMGQTVNLLAFAFGGSNPSVPTKKSERKLCGSSSVDRALAFQAGGRGFEPRLPLHSTRPCIICLPDKTHHNFGD